MTFTVTSFTLEELSDLLETATYGNNYNIDYGLTPEARAVAEGKYSCDKAADALLKGHDILIYDTSCHEDGYGINDDLPYHGEKDVNWLRKGRHKYVYTAWDGSTVTCYVPMYRINLKTLLSGLSSCTESAEYLSKHFIQENGDLISAYNILQCAVFGEVVYG